MDTKIIREKNDKFRKTFIGGLVLLTRTVENSSKREQIIEMVKGFDSFNEGNDPWQEHDFGTVKIKDESYFFKIDYYDKNYRCFQEGQTNRVLTIMHSSEY